MDEEVMRLECLRLAVGMSEPHDYSEVIAAAEKMYRFVSGKSEPELAA